MGRTADKQTHAKARVPAAARCIKQTQPMTGVVEPTNAAVDPQLGGGGAAGGGKRARSSSIASHWAAADASMRAHTRIPLAWAVFGGVIARRSCARGRRGVFFGETHPTQHRPVRPLVAVARWPRVTRLPLKRPFRHKHSFLTVLCCAAGVATAAALGAQAQREAKAGYAERGPMVLPSDAQTCKVQGEKHARGSRS